MLATQFSGYLEHKKAHDEFTFTVIKSVNEFKNGKMFVLEKFAGFLKKWISSHIAVMDKQYGLYFRKIVAIGPNGKLSKTLEKAIESCKHINIT